jgi:hypothetical protein
MSTTHPPALSKRSPDCGICRRGWGEVPTAGRPIHAKTRNDHQDIAVRLLWLQRHFLKRKERYDRDGHRKETISRSHRNRGRMTASGLKDDLTG